MRSSVVNPPAAPAHLGLNVPDSNFPTAPITQASDDDPFGNLPEFHQVDQVVAKTRRVDDEFRDALERSHVTSDSSVSDSSVTDSNGFDSNPTGPVGAAIDDGMSMEEMVAAAVAQQQRRNQSAIAPKITVAEIQRAFQKEMSDFDRSASVKGRSLSVALTILILPIVFTVTVVLATLAMIALPLGWLPISFSTALTWGGLIWYPLVWSLLLAAWIPVFNLFFAAINVLFSGAKESEARRTLTVENQPVMHEFVSLICSQVGAPAPTRIELDTDFNASASFRQGWASFGKNDLVLTLGIPLIACQSTGQLASVIAHEFGHFRQGSAMRSNYMIRSLTGWFIERAYWGHFRAQLIDYYQDSEDSNDSLLAVFSFIGFVGRQMMLGFGLAGHAVAGSLSREMEFDADRHATYLVGTKNFIDSMARIERYGVAYSVTIENLRMLYVSSGILVDNIPRLMLHIGKTMPIDVVRRIADAKQTEKQERFDTHPPTRDRVNAAKKINQAGVFHLDRPATDLIRNWPATCQECTIDFYSSVLDDPVTVERLTPLEKIISSEHKLLLDTSK
jgi:Zn-dependent protease with chaperone function